ncbi:DUF2254 domain-containing protein [Roseomonas sp. F4]
MKAARLRQMLADLRASFWVRPAAMTLGAILLAETLVRMDGVIGLPDMLDDWIYAGGVGGARDVLGTIASATIGVAGTTFSITVAALTLASNQMGPRLLRNFTSDAGNQYALGALVATFAYALVALRSIHESEDVAFVPQLAVSVGLLFAFGCVGVLIWFLHHVASSISVDPVVAQVQQELTAALAAVTIDNPAEEPAELSLPANAAPLRAPGSGYLRVLDDATLVDWAVEHDALLQLDIRPGGFVFPGSVVGCVRPEGLQGEAQQLLAKALVLGDSRSVEQDLEYAVRQLVEIALRALSSGINDPFTAIGVLDRLGAALCGLAGRGLPTGRVWRDERLRLIYPTSDYEGLVDAMFHMLRQSGASQPAVMIRLLEVLAVVAQVETAPQRRATLRRHITLATAAALEGTGDAAARDAIEARQRAALAAAA